MASTKNTVASKAMKAAWTNWKAGRYTSWSECLKSAWAWAKRTFAKTRRVYVEHRFKFTEKAVNVNGFWFPLSQVTCFYQFKELDGVGTVKELEYIEVPTWLFNKKFL